MTLKFSEKAHRYWLDGKPVRGVTTLIGDGLPKKAIPYWAARTVAEWVADNEDGVAGLRDMGRGPMVDALKNVPWQKRDDAGVRGTDVHTLGEQVIRGEEVEVPDHLVDMVEGYVRFLDAFGVEPLLTETSVGHRAHWWAGRFDSVVTLTRGKWKGAVVLLDTKTANSGIWGETTLQTAAYASAEFYVLDGAPDAELPMPQIERTAAVHVTPSGSFLHPLCASPTAIKKAYGIFRHVAYVANQAKWIQESVGEPMQEPEGS